MKPCELDKRNMLQQTKPHVYEKVMKLADNIKNGIGMPIIQFQYNYGCNFTCEHCCINKMQRKQYSGKEPRHFTIPDVRNLAKEADAIGLPTFVITGGEPLLFKDFDQLVEAIDPSKFWLVSDSNGWLLDYQMASHLKSIGIDKIQLSVDGANSVTHDAFRRKEGSWKQCILATEACQMAGLDIIWQTCVWKGRPFTQEFIDLLELGKRMDVGIFIIYIKPIGQYEQRYDQLVTLEDDVEIERLRQIYNIFTHWTPSYDMDIGCIAVKRMVSITRYGDVMPCPFMHISLGNVFEEHLKDIIARGMSIKWFGKNMKGPCWIGLDRDFTDKILSQTYGDVDLPIPYHKVFTEADYDR